jgi:23S rRNA pseudouridine2457 synthase
MLVIFNKPFNVLSQFTDADGRETLADYIDIKNVYPAGRLDKDSEGLLLLTDNGKLQNKISNPVKKLKKHYWVQVEGEINDACIKQLENGVKLKDGMTKPASVKRISPPHDLWERIPPVRFRKTVPTQWIEVIISEGKNRQIRRMTAAVGHPTLRLVRHKIGKWELVNLQPGEIRILKDNFSL